MDHLVGDVLGESPLLLTSSVSAGVEAVGGSDMMSPTGRKSKRGH